MGEVIFWSVLASYVLICALMVLPAFARRR